MPTPPILNLGNWSEPPAHPWIGLSEEDEVVQIELKPREVAPALITAPTPVPAPQVATPTPIEPPKPSAAVAADPEEARYLKRNLGEIYSIDCASIARTKAQHLAAVTGQSVAEILLANDRTTTGAWKHSLAAELTHI